MRWRARRRRRSAAQRRAAQATLTPAEQDRTTLYRLLGVSSTFKDMQPGKDSVTTREETIAMINHFLGHLGMANRIDRELSEIYIADTKR